MNHFNVVIYKFMLNAIVKLIGYREKEKKEAALQLIKEKSH